MNRPLYYFWSALSYIKRTMFCHFHFNSRIISPYPAVFFNVKIYKLWQKFLYFSILKWIFFSKRICVFNNTRLIRYESYVIDDQPFCTNQKNCIDNKKNQSFICPLWKSYCGPLYDAKNKDSNNSSKIQRREITDNDYLSDDLTIQKFAHLCRYFEMEDSVRLKQGIPGISSSEPITGIL